MDYIEEKTEEDLEYELRREQRRKRRAKMRRRRRRRAMIQRATVLGCACLCLFFLAGAGLRLMTRETGKKKEKAVDIVTARKSVQLETSLSMAVQTSDGEKVSDEKEKAAMALMGASPSIPLTAERTERTTGVDDAVQSTYALLIDLDNNTITAQKNAYDRINPASMTKILTLLVAAEHITDLDDTITITREITDYSYSNDCSAVGFDEGEAVTVRDLLYGTILPSGGDAAAGLAMYVSGSLEGFVDLMNQKLAQLGLAKTAYFTNCVGLYDENHYCTLYDIAVILKAAVDHELCREILAARTYTTSGTVQHPEGIRISNWFMRRIEDKEMGGEVLGAKTGYVVQSGNCAASYFVSDSGKQYICVTAEAHSSWRCIYDHVEIYKRYTE